MFVTPHIFLLLWEVTFPMFQKLYGLMLHTKYLRNSWLQNFCVFSCVSLIVKIHFSKFSKMRGFLFHEKYVINPYVRNICVFPYFSCTTEIRFSHVLIIAWIFDSRKIFQKPITFECLCFLILFPYYENSLFLCFGNCMDFCFR